MKAELQQKLIEEFPSLFSLTNEGPMRSCMCFGCEHGDGWFDILYNLCKEIKDTNTKFVQIKEKFGALRVYIESGTDEVYAAIDRAEALSAKTCESCGKPGVCRSGGWIQTLCDECAGPNKPPSSYDEEEN